MDIKKQIIETTEYKQKQDVSLYQDVCHIIEQGRERAYFRQFYLTINNKQILQTCLQNLTWSHILRALRVDDPIAIRWYLETASQEMWSVRTLDRNISTQYYVRHLCSST